MIDILILWSNQLSEYEEYTWLLVLLSDLKRNYPDHHNGVLSQMIDIINYRIKCLEK